MEIDFSRFKFLSLLAADDETPSSNSDCSWGGSCFQGYPKRISSVIGRPTKHLSEDEYASYYEDRANYFTYFLMASSTVEISRVSESKIKFSMNIDFAEIMKKNKFEDVNKYIEK